jgi:hypothetical protein
MPMPAHLKPDAAAQARVITADPTNDLQATDLEVQAFLDTVDLDATWDQEAANLTVEIWDSKTPINGFTITRKSHPEVMAVVDAGGEIFLVRDETGRVLQFQWHEPDVAGINHIAKGVGMSRGGKAKDNHTHARVMGRVQPHLYESVRGKRAAEGKTAHRNTSMADGVKAPVRKANKP